MELLGPAIAFLVAFWVYSDAKGRGKTTTKALLWFAGVFFILIVFLPLWFITRPKVKTCFQCGEKCQGEAEKFFCSRCNIEL